MPVIVPDPSNMVVTSASSAKGTAVGLVRVPRTRSDSLFSTLEKFPSSCKTDHGSTISETSKVKAKPSPRIPE